MTGEGKSGWSGAPRTDAAEGASDGRLVAPAALRNASVIAAAVATRFGGAAGAALEIGSGTGQHVVALAGLTPGLRWTPSDPSARARESVAAWAAAERSANVTDPIDLDAAGDWPAAAAGPFALIFSANVIHIAPWAVAEGIFRAAGARLSPGGSLALYGPFREAGAHISESNAAFDASLRGQDARWGVRDLEDLDALAAGAGLARVELVEMPANNRIAIWRRGG